MKNFSKHLIRNIIVISLAVLLACCTALVTYAYFTTKVVLYTNDGSNQYFEIGMELNTFFDQVNSDSSKTQITNGTALGIKCTDTSCGTLYTDGNTISNNTVYYKNVGTAESPEYEYVYNSAAKWGSASNPYLISKINHLQNLYVLQNSGYFTSLTGNNKDSTKIKENCLPYFLVCNSDGTPAIIDGEGRTFEYIGNDVYPFLGYFGGNFTDGTVSVGPDELESTQSVIYDLISITDSDIIDVGLFGRIGYLGDDTTATNKQFSGVASTVRDLLLYDVQVKVQSKSVWASIASLIQQHLFTFGQGNLASSNSVISSCENHHIGILAGHVDYATVEYISVYYSSDTVPALDVQHTDHTSGTAANYYSVSGILGFCNEMNSDQANGVITIGGISNDDINIPSSDIGSGGGVESGTGRGYVTAAEVYEYYHDNGKIVKMSVTGYTDKYGLLVEFYNDRTFEYVQDGETKQTILALTDGTPVKVASDLSYVSTFTSYTDFFGTTQTFEDQWKNYIVHDIANNRYMYYIGTTPIYATSVVDAGVSIKYAASIDKNSNYNYLCTQYERERVGSTITGMSQKTNRYYFYDGVFTFSISEATDTIENTWKNGVDKIYLGEDKDSSWTQDVSALPNSVVAFMMPIKTEGQLKSGKEIFIAYKDTNNDYHLVTLSGNSDYHSGQQDNAVTTPQTTLSLVSNDLRNTIKSSLDNNTLTLESTSSSSLGQIKENWSSIQILNVGSANGVTLEQLKTLYQIKVTEVPQDITAGTYEDDDITAITAALKNALNTSALSAIKSTYYTIDSVTPINTYNDTFLYFALKDNIVTSNISNVYNELKAYDNRYYPYTAVTKTTIDGFTFLKVNNVNNYVAFSDITSGISAKNANYYSIDAISMIKTVAGVSYFSLVDSSKTVNISSIQNSIDVYNSTIYQDDGATAVSSTLLSHVNIDSSGTQISQAENKIYTNGYYYFYTFNVGATTCRYRLFYVNASGTETTVVNSKYKSTLENWDDVLYDMFNSHTSITDVDGVETILVTRTATTGSTKIPLLYELEGTYYRSFRRNTSSSDYISGSNAAKFENSSGTRYRMIIPFTAYYDYILATYTGTGVKYTLNGKTIECTNVSATSNYFTSIAQGTETTSLYGTNYKVWNYTYNGSTKQTIMFVRYQIDGILLRKSTSTGVKHQLINGSGNLLADNLSGSYTTTGRTISVNGVSHAIYTRGGYLGVCVAKFEYDQVILQISSGSGISYNVVNTAGSVVASSNATVTETDETVTIKGTAYKVCVSNGHLGVCFTKQKYDGVMLQTMTGSGASYSLVNGSGNVIGTTNGSGQFVEAVINGNFVNTTNSFTLGGVTYQIYYSNGYLGVRLANFKVDGYFTANVTSSGTTYKLNDTTIIDNEPILLSATYKDSSNQDASININYPLSNGTTTKRYNLYVSGGYLAVKFIHHDAGQQVYYKFWHDNSSNSSDPYVLNILRRNYALGGNKYGVAVGTEAFLGNTDNFSSNGFIGECTATEYNPNCTVILNGDGTAYLQYTINGTTRYLSFGSVTINNVTTQVFTTTTSRSDAAKLYLFTSEGTHDSSIGNHIVPIAGTGNSYNADEYVLWPDNIYLSGNSSTSAYNPTNNYVTDTTYTLKKLSDLEGWNDGHGHAIDKEDLECVFSLGQGISDVNMLELWGGNTGTLAGSDGYVKAPIGTDGEYSYIPTGCVAFKVNTSNENNKIRVIVAVPVSDYYYGELLNASSSTYLNPAAGTGLNYAKDYSFCMWKVDSTQAGNTGGQSYSFSASNCYASFELPRSSTYDPQGVISQRYYSNVSGNSLSVTGTNNVSKYIYVNYGDKVYRSYLNGSQVLVAYEFTAAEEGIYLLGSTQECRIVFFSADSSASTGKDGIESYRLGTIDFVYDDALGTTAAQKILTTDLADPTVDGEYNYGAYYYPTLCLLSTDNNNSKSKILTGDTDISSKTVEDKTYSYSNINDFTIYVHRKRTSISSDIAFTVKGGEQYSDGIADAAYIMFARYSIDSDKINRSDSLR